MTAHQNNLDRDFSRLNITNLAPKQYSPNLGKKIAPVVPPKPKKASSSTSSDSPGFRNGSSTPVAGMATPLEEPLDMESYSDSEFDKGASGEQPAISAAVNEKRSVTTLSFMPGSQTTKDIAFAVGNSKPRPFVPAQSPAKLQPAVNNHFPSKTNNGQAVVDAQPPKYENGSRFRTPAPAEGNGNYVAGAQQQQAQHPNAPNYANDPNYGNSTNYSNPSNYSNSSNYSNASNYSNMANYSDSSNYSNSSNYSDFSNYDHYRPPGSLTSYGAYTPPLPEDELPPPPPPEPSSYSPSTNHNFPPPPPDEFPPPPSPVSSSYSELRRAANAQNYATYGPVSSQSSTYESIYEPIHPRPQSQISNRSLYSTGSSLYTPYGSNKAKAQGAVPHAQTRTGTGESGPVKEDEVDVLTNLLVRSMENSGDPDFFGICSKCGEKVTGEGTGCTAMEHVFHITCFTCFVCQTPLQGKPFYAMDGKPYCEEDYLNTLEKCSVCTQPILDRILRATGKPYHPKCFTCVVCGKSLDGIPFTVDATNQIHCIEDFHKKFAPRCCVCKQPIMPEPGLQETVRVVALDKSFHVNCYKCEDCGLVLSSEAEGRGCYPLDDHILCKSCNAKRVQLLTSHMATEL